MKKIIYITLCYFTFAGFINLTINAMPNPWVDCGQDINCGVKKAGFSFPLKVKNPSVRAMDGMLEINFPLDKKRNVTVRKSEIFDGIADENGIIDISGVYEKYPVNKTIMINKSVPFNVKGHKNKFYVVNFAAESGYYSFYCKKGMKLKDINYLYHLLKNAEGK